MRGIIARIGKRLSLGALSKIFMSKRYGPPIHRFFKYVQLDIRRGCWLWLGTLTSGNGKYGFFYDEDHMPRQCHAARWIYEYFKGPLLPGYEPDHLCRIRSCVNPDHLEGVTKRENI